MGEEAWLAGMNPALPEDDDDKVLDNPYQYTEFRTDDRPGTGYGLRRAGGRRGG